MHRSIASHLCYWCNSRRYQKNAVHVVAMHSQPRIEAPNYGITWKRSLLMCAKGRSLARCHIPTYGVCGDPSATVFTVLKTLRSRLWRHNRVPSTLSLVHMTKYLASYRSQHTPYYILFDSVAELVQPSVNDIVQMWKRIVRRMIGNIEIYKHLTWEI